MIDGDQPKTGVRRWVARATAGGAGLVRVNEDVLEHCGYRFWLSVAVGAGSRLPAVVRRLCTERRLLPDTPASFADSPLASEAVLGASRANSTVATFTLRADSPATGLRADARHAGTIDALRRDGRRVCELDRLALDQIRDCAQIFGALVQVASLFAREVHGATDLVIEAHPLQAETYRRLFGFTRANAEKPRTRLGASSVLLRLDLARAAQESASAAAGGDNGTDGCARFTLDAAEKKEAARRMHEVVASACRRLSETNGSHAEPHDDDVIAGHNPFLAVTQTATVAQLESHSYDDGLRAGVQARLRNTPITPYQRVGLDGFARGFRSGYFASRGREPQIGGPSGAKLLPERGATDGATLVR